MRTVPNVELMLYPELISIFKRLCTRKANYIEAAAGGQLHPILALRRRVFIGRWAFHRMTESADTTLVGDIRARGVRLTCAQTRYVDSRSRDPCGLVARF